VLLVYGAEEKKMDYSAIIISLVVMNLVNGVSQRFDKTFEERVALRRHRKPIGKLRRCR
jgi:hypothetical protein